MTQISTKTHTVISVEMWGKARSNRTASNRYIKQKEIDDWLNLKRELYEKVTGKSYQDLISDMMAFHDEVYEEELRDFGIHISRSWDRFTHYFLPKDALGNEVAQFLLNQIHRPARQLKRESSYDRGPSTYFRDLAEESRKRLEKKLNTND